MSAVLAGVSLFLVMESPRALAATLIVNGDFEAGNSGFTSDYPYVPPGPGSLGPAGVYTVDTNPQNNNGNFYAIGDHTTGTGLMMIVNGAETTGISVWEGTSSFALTVGKDYDFSAWVASVFPSSPAELTFMVGSTPIGTLTPTPDGTWNRLFATFTAEEEFPTFRLVNANAAFFGNDFAVDDIDVFLSGTTTRPPDAGPLLNISTRLQVLTADQVLIGGFIVTGSEPKTVILRAIGPALGAFGISGPLADPVLELRAADGSLIQSNDNWKMDQQDAIEETGLAPTDNLESAILAILDPGSYTAIVSGKSGGTGVGLVEAYDLGQTADSQLANISTRGLVQSGNDVMIGGFIIGGEAGSGDVLIRAIGPTLTDFGVAGALDDPTLELRDGQGALVSSNNDWMDDQQDEIEALGLAPQDELESAILATLVPGAYTAIVASQSGGTGVGLVEVYRLP